MARRTIPLFTGFVEPGSADNPFLTGDARVRSLNRTRIAAQPDASLDEDLAGRSAYELLSATAVETLVRIEAPDLGLDPERPDLLLAFDDCFHDSRTAPAAGRVADTLGRRLGAVLLVLARGAAADRHARPEWGKEHWDFWHLVRRVVVGGGLWSGALGAAATAEANRFLSATGGPAVERSPYGVALPMVGLARYAPLDVRRMMLFDFGHTRVKHGLATYRDGTLASVEIRPSLAAPCSGPDYTSLAGARQCWVAMRDIILGAWRREVPFDESDYTGIGVALATHLNNGHPFQTDQGCYGLLQSLAPHLGQFLRDDLAARIRRYRSFALLHDGLAAAAAHAEDTYTVVLTLGTAIGAGYPPAPGGLRPLDRYLRVVPASSPRLFA
jgi:hypothetical protein